MVSCSISALGLGNFVGATLLDGFTVTVDSGVSILTDASRLAMVLETTTSQATVFSALHVYFLMRRTLLLTMAINPGVAWQAYALLMAVPVAIQMASVAI